MSLPFLQTAKYWLRGLLSLEQRVINLLPTAWLDATEMYAKSKIAVDLNGTDEYLDGNGQSISIGTAFTMSLWIKTGGSFPLGQTLIASKNYFTSGFDGNAILRINDISDLSFFSYDGQGSVESVVESSAGWATSTYYHIFLIGDGVNAKLYIDNIEVASSTHTKGLDDFLNGFYLGNDVAGANSFFNGAFDQVSIFDKALNSSERDEIYNSGNGLNHADLNGSESYYSNIVAWYDFNSINNLGREYNQPSHAVALDGALGDYFQSTSTDFDITETTPFSVGGWFKFVSTTGSTKVFISNINFSTVDGYEAFLVTSGKVRFIVSKDSTNRVYIESTVTLSPDTWYHLLFTQDGSNTAAGLEIYVNGVAGSTTITDTPPAGVASPSQFRIGSIQGSLTPDFVVDESFFYSAELTAANATSLYNNGTVAPARTLIPTTNLVSDWSFDEQDPAIIGQDKYGTNDLTPNSIVEADLVGGKDGLDLTEVSISSANAVAGHIEGESAGFDGVTKWTDRSTGSNDVTQTTLANTPKWFDNYVNSTGDSVWFDGSNDVVDTGATTFAYEYTQAFSCFALVKFENVASNEPIISEMGAATAERGWSFRGNASKLSLFINNDKGSSVYINVDGSTTLVDGTWYMVGFTYDGSGNASGVKLFVADVEETPTVASDTLAGNTILGSGTTTIGGENSLRFQGEIAQLKVFNTELTADNITLLKDYYNDKYGLSL